MEMFGDVSAAPCHQIMYGDSQPCPQCPIEGVLSTRRPAMREWTSEKGRSFLVHYYPFSDVDGSQVVLKLGIDITERKKLEKEVMEASMEERRRIGYDLHDSLGQTLTGVAFLSKVLQQRLAEKNLPEASDADEIVRQINASVSQTRSLARGLLPVKVESDGLINALHEYARDIEDLYRISCVFECEREIPIVDNVIAIHVYHIAQESVANALRHGKARRIVIRLDANDGEVVLTVTDDGKGIESKNLKGDGLGLRIMNHRAVAIGGTLLIDGNPGVGTSVRCAFPQPVSGE